MMWFVFALVAPLLWGTSNLIDEKLERDGETPLALVAITGLFAGIPALVLFFTGQFAVPASAAVWLLAIVGGVLSLAVYFPYFKALTYTSPATVILMWNMSPLFVVLLAWFFLHERLVVQDYIAVVLLVASAAVSSYSPAVRAATKNKRAFLWMLLASLLIAADSVLEKAVFEAIGFRTGLAWLSAGSLLTAIGIIAVSSKTRRVLRRSLRLGMLRLFVLNEALDVGAATAGSYANSVGPVTVVHTIGGLQPLFVMIIGALFFTSQRRTPLKQAGMLQFSVAIALAIAGFALLKTSLDEYF